jgi:VIT1/CCC1 family predicted Fe2+/Mn2+ transporter
MLTVKLNSTGGEGLENQQMSAGAMIGLAIILGALIALFPGLLLWFAWLGVILLFIGGILALFMR